MRSVFIAFATTACLLITVTAVVGTMVSGQRYFDHHFALGLVTTLFICLGHCVVFTYFMATGKMIRLAVDDAGLDERMFQRSRALKLRAYRALMSAVIMALAAALTGGWITYHPERASLHLVVVLTAGIVQLLAWWSEFQAISHNGQLMNEVFDQHNQIKGAHEIRHLQ